MVDNFGNFGTGRGSSRTFRDISDEDFESLVVMVDLLRREVKELGRLIKVLVEVYRRYGYGDNGGTEEDKRENPAT